jgi:hypothetical protein
MGVPLIVAPMQRAGGVIPVLRGPDRAQSMHVEPGRNSDRLEILLVDYSTAIDNRRFDDLDKVFTPDA